MSTEPRTLVVTPAALRLLEKATPGPGGCAIWTGSIHKSGYGIAYVDSRHQFAHRALYRLLMGPIARGIHIDHACHNQDSSCPGGTTCLHRRCINPHHLEAVTAAENARRSPHTLVGRNLRKTHCDNGHPFDEDNTYIRKDGRGRVCRRCRSDRMSTYWAAKKANRPTDLPTCGHISRFGNQCTRPPGHSGKHHTQTGGAA
ncbi:hypothetical protein [Streptomyces sp. CC219B]|uniref:hypothetical protein n=1 Tax=Streptomyces sp. CC219B TaxID=3044574 RepID=UPI0024A926EC|nr:hypothetical protein [Streptomyces sp. CC219B]